MNAFEGRVGLPGIPVVQAGTAFPLETLQQHEARAHALMDCATAGVSQRTLRALDAVSRRWLVKQGNALLPEIDAIAERLGRPGAYFLSVNYEWGCTCRVAPSPDGRSARLVRVLDWVTGGLGRYVLAAHVVGGSVGPFVALTWPGYTGVLQAMAPGRFSAALNQAPMRQHTGLFHLDWALGRARVWRLNHPTPAQLLRRVFETAADFAEAKRLLAESPICAPAIFSIAGINAHETAVIERTETDARVHEGNTTAANHWQAPGWRGLARGNDSPGRACGMHGVSTEMDTRFAWLRPPILNWNTRLVMIADARQGRLVAQGFEPQADTVLPATAPLELAV
ncbi:hypothetical protein C6Y62_02305 [Hyphomicrobium sulfonivorans]|nr:hypothetical protein [Hyphomicrobium sulfonivorans]MBI1648815.1 hypothetical protein [Hyphomicrobium sulfonivorans]NSL70650.1 hypothetical protein [Hyphomicrobium sulfonivorans]